MTALLYILLAIVIGIAIWQIISIFNLKGVIATEKDNNTQGILFAFFGIFFYGLMIFSFWKYSVILLPEAASVEGARIENLYIVTMGIILFVQAITQFLLLDMVIASGIAASTIPTSRSSPNTIKITAFALIISSWLK